MTVRVVHIPEQPGYASGRLGRHVRHDPRSRAYARPVTGAELVSVRHSRHVDVLDQGNLGSCTGSAMVGALGTTPAWEPLPEDLILDQDLAEYVYSAATRLDDVRGTWPPTDTGSDGLSVCKVAKSQGWIAGYRWAFTWEAFLDALLAGPVLVGMPWYDSFDVPDADGIAFITPTAGVRGGHEVVADELDVDRQLVGFTNSWGPGWGRAGRFYLPWGDLRRLLAEDGDAAIPVPLGAPAPTPLDQAGDTVLRWLLGIAESVLAWLRWLVDRVRSAMSP